MGKKEKADLYSCFMTFCQTYKALKDEKGHRKQKVSLFYALGKFDFPFDIFRSRLEYAMNLRRTDNKP